MTLIELKSKAYDILAQLEYLKAELDKTNQEIAKMIQEENKEDGSR